MTNGKLANNAVTAAKVAPESLTGANINLSALGTVPQAANAAHAAEAAEAWAATRPPAPNTPS